jgi:hypothetical protein
MDILEEQAHLGPSLGQEAHRLDAIAQTLGKVHEMNVSFGGKGRDLGGPHLALASPMIFLWRLKRHFGGLDVTLGLGFWW